MINGGLMEIHFSSMMKRILKKLLGIPKRVIICIALTTLDIFICIVGILLVIYLKKVWMINV